MINQWILEEVVRTSLLAWLAYILALGVYNLCFHPLSKYPGPKLAALTRLWKAYIELVRRESMVQKLFELHAIYGLSSLSSVNVVKQRLNSQATLSVLGRMRYSIVSL